MAKEGTRIQDGLCRRRGRRGADAAHGGRGPAARPRHRASRPSLYGLALQEGEDLPTSAVLATGEDLDRVVFGC